MSRKSRKNGDIRAQFQVKEDILCLPSEINPSFPKQLQELTSNHTTSGSKQLCEPGINPAPYDQSMDAIVVPISNLPQSKEIERPIPDQYQFEIYQLRQDIRSLTYDVRRQNDKIGKAILAIRDEIRFWSLGLHDHQWETLGQVMKRMRHLESVVALLEDPSPTGEMLPTKTAKAKG